MFLKYFTDNDTLLKYVIIVTDNARAVAMISFDSQEKLEKELISIPSRYPQEEICRKIFY